jgi:hypothetical protein
MTLFVFILLFLFNPAVVSAQTKPLYQLPEISASSTAENEQNIIVAGDSGLFRIVGNSTAVPLWTEGKVSRIAHVDSTRQDGSKGEKWFFVTTEGIVESSDLVSFEKRNKGLPLQTIKQYDGETVSFVKKIKALKDICINPLNPQEIVTATEDAVYLSRDGGSSWKSLGSMSRWTNGIKAVAVADMPLEDGPGTQLVVFMSHPIFGLSYILPDSTTPKWIDVSAGFDIMKTLSSPDEISDILPIVRTAADGSQYTEVYMSQTFIPRLYKFGWKNKRGECIWRGKEPSDTIDGLTRIGDVLLYTRPGTLGSFNLNDHTSPGLPVNLPQWKKDFAALGTTVNSAWIPQRLSGFFTGFVLNELWLLEPEKVRTPFADKVMDRRAFYIPANHGRTVEEITNYRKILADNKLNAVVIDMKDDYGLLRYDSKDPVVLKKGYVSKYAIDLDQFVREFKKDNTYLIARIVVFKDKNLALYDKDQFAVWDAFSNTPWVGIRNYEETKDETTGEVTGKTPVYYDEQWVDPYCPQVWEYNIQIARELVKRGFDEIQFDYIRFPTDGYNLKNAVFRYKSKGMDKESALISFLSYARKNIPAPIGIDIYGANGWYRSGARTGQDVEMLSNYVDVISPMFYPSHFEQIFLNYSPAEERPYRIYFYGTYRNSVIARNKSVIRPWVQAFKLKVSYDLKYYNSDYVRREIFGIRDSVDRGYMYWNNMGNYETVSPDVGDASYPWNSPEADPDFRKPTLTGGMNSQKLAAPAVNANISILDNVVMNGERDHSGISFNPLLKLMY